MTDGEAPGSSSDRTHRSTLRQATLILPKTGERIKRAFTLQGTVPEARSESDENDDDNAPLLGAGRRSKATRGQQAWLKAKEMTTKMYTFFTSTLGLAILKCSLAYLLGSLGTFYPPIADFLGKQDGKHMMATVTVYFHPARSAGSMIEATFIAFIAFLYAAFMSFTSMAMSFGFARAGQLQLGHIFVLVIFCGGGLGLVGWVKQNLGNPLINVGCSLTSLALITVLTKEGAVQAGTFSFAKVFQVLKMVSLGIVCTMAVSLIVFPVSARRELRKDLKKATAALGEMVAMITHSFLDGDEEELNRPSFVTSSNNYKSVFASFTKNLAEAKWEHYALGTEEAYHIEAKLAKILERLALDVSGLRSAAATQFVLMKNTPNGNSNMNTLVQSPSFSDFGFSQSPSQDFSSLNGTVEGGEWPNIASPVQESASDLHQSHMDLSQPDMQASVTAPDIFEIFISHLGPPMKSLAYTLKSVLEELPYGPGPEYSIMVNTQFRSSVLEANELFSKARKEALALVYKSKIPTAEKTSVAADIEEVAASCGYFSSSLQDFAEDMIIYLDMLDELKHQVEGPSRRRTWKWLMFWRKGRSHSIDPPEWTDQDETAQQQQSGSVDSLMKVTNTTLKRSSIGVKWSSYVEGRSKSKRSYQYRIWRALSFIRRDDIKYAIKVGFGAVLYAMWSFIPSTRPIYSAYRGEWGLLSYMLVCSMTIGSSNTTGLHRFGGTCLGAILAILAWIIADESPYVLALFGWLISLGCFYIIVGQGKGPMGRFIMLTYNLSALYAYSLSVKDGDDDDDEGGISPEIWEITKHRVIAVFSGCIWGLIITRLIWPISARRKLKEGLAILWLRMGLIWKRDPLAIFLRGPSQNPYMDISESLALQRFLAHLEGLRGSASSELRLRGPFPDRTFQQMLQGTSRMLDAFHAMNVIIRKDLKATPGEAEILRFTKAERVQLSLRISHLFSVLASSLKLEYPLNDAMPNVEPVRDKLLAKIFDFRKNATGNALPSDEDYELLYAYALVTGQLAHEIREVGALIETIYGILDDDSFRLQ